MAPKLALPPTPPRLPLVLQRRSSEEYTPLPTHPLNRPVVAQVRAQGPKHAARLSMSLGDYWASRQGLPPLYAPWMRPGEGVSTLSRQRGRWTTEPLARRWVAISS